MPDEPSVFEARCHGSRRASPLRLRAPLRRLRIGLATAVVAAFVWGCATAPPKPVQTAGDALASRGLALASPATPFAPSVETVMVEGDITSWAEKGFGHFESGRYAMALPYLVAALESGEATILQRAYLHWFASLAYHQVGERNREIASLELFLLSTSVIPPKTLEGLWLADVRGAEIHADRARELARARLFAYRIERGGGFGGAGDPVVVSSFSEENLVLTLLRCGPERRGRVELLDQEVLERDGRRFDHFHGLCAETGTELDMVFDISAAFRQRRPETD